MTRTPWGRAQHTDRIAEGVALHQCAGHGGLSLSPARWAELPAEVRQRFMDPGWAEEDCEYPIAMALLGLRSPWADEAVYVEAAWRTVDMGIHEEAAKHLPPRKEDACESTN